MKLTTLDKSLQIIELLSKNPQGLSLMEMSNMLGFPKSTIHHVLATFLPYDYVAQSAETKKYCLGFRFLSIGRVILDNIDVRSSLATYIGFSTEPHAAAGGKVLLSELSPREIREIYHSRPLKTYGKNTITSMAQLLKELEKTRIEGYAIDDEEYYEGVRCVSAPVRAGGKIVAAISITGSIFTMTMERIGNELRRLVVEKAEKVSAEMQW